VEIAELDGDLCRRWRCIVGATLAGVEDGERAAAFHVGGKGDEGDVAVPARSWSSSAKRGFSSRRSASQSRM